MPAKPVSLQLALHGGDEYELLFTSPPNRHIPSTISGVPITCIGEIIRPSKIFLIDSLGKKSVLRPRGWEHFRHQ